MFSNLRKDHFIYPCFKFNYKDFPIFSVMSNATNKLKLFAKSRDNQIYEISRAVTLHKGGIHVCVPDGNNGMITIGDDKTMKKTRIKFSETDRVR
jgi:hypothetical protein